MEFEVLLLPPADFPPRWIDYTCFDVVALSLDELRLLTKTNPAAFAAMRRWVRAGGQLWIGNVGEQLEQLSSLSKLFRLRESVASSPADDDGDSTGTEANRDSSAAGWQAVRFRDGIPVGQAVTFLDITTGANRVVRDPQVIMRLQNNPNFVTTNPLFEEVDQGQEQRTASSSSEWFVEQRSGLGRVRAFRGANEIPSFSLSAPLANPNVAANGNGAAQMPASLSAALQSTSRWEVRHGLAPSDANLDFANLLVPGVGLAPVTEFRVLITLFVLLIGPVNYWLLKRWGRLQLLVLTVPLAALLMTATLFAYAIVADGFGTTVRAHSFTTLDQRTGEAACWTRLSYYSGLAPGEGLTMPSDIVLYPIIPGWNESTVDATLGVNRDVVWNANEAKLSRGWLRSRKPTQYLTVRARKSPHRLELAAGGGKLRATNKLGTAVHLVLVVDEAGKLLAGEDLADGAVSFLQPIERVDAVRQFRKLVTDNEPQPPPALADSDSHFAAMQRRQRRQMYRGRFGLQYSEAKLGDNLVKGVLDDLAGLTGGPALELPPRSYVAVTATGPEVEFGMRGADEVGSFHVIEGQW